MFDFNGTKLLVGDEVSPKTAIGLHKIIGFRYSSAAEYVILRRDDNIFTCFPYDCFKVRSWKELYEISLSLKNSTNLSEILVAFSKIRKEIWARMEEEGEENINADVINKHEICKIFADRIYHLTNADVDMDYVVEWMVNKLKEQDGVI